MTRAAVAMLLTMAVGLAAGCGPARTAPAVAQTDIQTDAERGLITAELTGGTHAPGSGSAPAVALTPAAGAAPQPAPAITPAELLRLHNAWADSIQHLQSPADILINFPTGEVGEDGRAKRLKQDLGGFLSVEKPDRLLLHGRESVYGDVFKIGMNATMFWLWVRPKVDTVWVGTRGGAWEQRFLMSPRDLMAALGLFRIDLLPGVKAAFSADERHYCLAEDRTMDGEAVPMRRVWFDRRTLRPARVDLFDEGGRCVLMAELMKYERVGGIDICTVYRTRFYGNDEVGLVLQLKAVDLAKPLNPKLFEYRLPPGTVEKNLDAM